MFADFLLQYPGAVGMVLLVVGLLVFVFIDKVMWSFVWIRAFFTFGFYYSTMYDVQQFPALFDDKKRHYQQIKIVDKVMKSRAILFNKKECLRL